jgi:carnitine 3-dehydrogenase
MSLLRPIHRVAVVGLGTIGLRWAAVFAHRGFAVDAWDPDPLAWERATAALPGLFDELERLMPATGTRGSMRFHRELADALARADFVQENAPENLALKRDLLARIDLHAPRSVVIASSSSALLPSDMQVDCRHPQRVVLGHPFNPAHLMPLVEVVGGRLTRPDAVEHARSFYERLGKKPVVMNRELTGHLALRLMGAMWREAIALVAEGTVSARDIDRAFCFGPGPKWTLQGSFISNHLGADGIEAFLAKYGGTYEAIWADLRSTPQLDDALRQRIADETRQAIDGRSDDSLRSQRDAGLIDLLAVQRRHGAL